MQKVDAEDIKKNLASEIHVKKDSKQKTSKLKKLTRRSPRLFSSSRRVECGGEPLWQMSNPEREDDREESSQADRDAKAARFDFWSITGNYIHRNHVVPRQKLYVPKGDSPIPLKYKNVDRQSDISPDVLQEKLIENCWNVAGDQLLSDPWIGVACFTILDKSPLDGHIGVGIQVTKKQVTSRPENIWPEDALNPQDPDSKWNTVNYRGNSSVPRKVLYKHSYRPRQDCIYLFQFRAAQNENCTFFQNDSDAIILNDYMLACSLDKVVTFDDQILFNRLEKKIRKLNQKHYCSNIYCNVFCIRPTRICSSKIFSNTKTLKSMTSCNPRIVSSALSCHEYSKCGVTFLCLRQSSQRLSTPK